MLSPRSAQAHLRYTLALTGLALATAAGACTTSKSDPAAGDQPTPAAAAEPSDDPAGKAKKAKDGPDAGEDAASPASATDANADPAEKSEAGDLLGWMDPEAGALLLAREGLDLKPQAVAAVFAWPPRVLKLWQDLVDARAELAHQLGDANFIEPGGPALVFTPPIATGNYIVLRHNAGSAAGDRLQAQGYGEPEQAVAGQPRTFTPSKPSRWKVVLLDDHHLAFVPLREPGTGLGPLTAGRDLPPGEARAALRQRFEADPGLAMYLVAGGPMLHFDLDDDVAQFEFGLRRWQNSGLDYVGRMVVLEDPGASVTALKNRDLSGENHQIRSLADRVAIGVDQGTIATRLQLTRDDLRHLRAR